MVDSIDVLFIWLNLLAHLTPGPQRAGWGAVWKLEGLLDPGRSKCNVIAGNFGLGIYTSGCLTDIAGRALLWQPGQTLSKEVKFLAV